MKKDKLVILEKIFLFTLLLVLVYYLFAIRKYNIFNTKDDYLYFDWFFGTIVVSVLFINTFLITKYRYKNELYFNVFSIFTMINILVIDLKTILVLLAGNATLHGLIVGALLIILGFGYIFARAYTFIKNLTSQG